MVKLYDKVELLQDLKTSNGRPILQGTRGTILKVYPDNTYSVEIKIHNPMMFRSYEFVTLTLPHEKFKVVELKSNGIRVSEPSFSDTQQSQALPKPL